MAHYNCNCCGESMVYIAPTICDNCRTGRCHRSLKQPLSLEVGKFYGSADGKTAFIFKSYKSPIGFGNMMQLVFEGIVEGTTIRTFNADGIYIPNDRLTDRLSPHNLVEDLTGRQTVETSTNVQGSVPSSVPVDVYDRSRNTSDRNKVIEPSPWKPPVECHGLDTPDTVHFYENDFYVFSNFSSFQICYKPNPQFIDEIIFPTSEHMYHYRRFILAYKQEGVRNAGCVAEDIIKAPSAHEAYQIAQRNKHLQVSNWDDIKVEEMFKIITLKRDQHEYVAYKLEQSKGRLLVENSWRDNFWGWGPQGDGLNVLGRLWMKLRDDTTKSGLDNLSSKL